MTRAITWVMTLLETLLQAARPALVAAFTLWGSPVTWLEIVAFVLALAMVACNLRVHVAGWPLAILSSMAYALLFADSKLYGESALQGLFIVLALWGWWQWLRGTASDGSALQVRTMSPRSRAAALVATLLAWPALAWLLMRTTDSDVPWFDALPTAGSITGQVLLACKWVENWPVWLVVNLVSVALFAYKGLTLTAVLYAVFAALSVVGWKAWHQRALQHV
jgi:nicotinamide mononucleotide transporter